MKYYYNEKLVKQSKVMEYKYTIYSVDNGECFHAFITYENAVSYLNRIARDRAYAFEIALASAKKQINEKFKIVEFTKTEA